MIGRQSQLRQELKKLERIKDIWDNKDYNESVRKAQKMSTHAMLDWIDKHIVDIGKVAEDYRIRGEKTSLEELRKAISILQALTEELMAKEEMP